MNLCEFKSPNGKLNITINEEVEIFYQNNELLTGVLDKNEIGNSDYGLFHSFYEIYGPNLTGELILSPEVFFLSSSEL